MIRKQSSRENLSINMIELHVPILEDLTSVVAPGGVYIDL